MTKNIRRAGNRSDKALTRDSDYCNEQKSLYVALHDWNSKKER